MWHPVHTLNSNTAQHVTVSGYKLLQTQYDGDNNMSSLLQVLQKANFNQMVSWVIPYFTF